MSKINKDLDKRLKETEACYKFEKLNYDSGLLDTNVDVTYIIHLENSGRYDNILKQLEKYKPTKTVYILLNKGFSKCNKTGIESSQMHLLYHRFDELNKLEIYQNPKHFHDMENLWQSYRHLQVHLQFGGAPRPTCTKTKIRQCLNTRR